jgi:hypothetical protein
MRKSLAILFQLSFAGLALAQNLFREPEQKSDPTLLPPPMVTSFESRPLYRPGEENIKPPVVLAQPEPKPLKNFRPAKVVLWCIVGLDGKAHMIKVAKRDTMETEMKAVDNLREWKFKPANDTKNKADVDMLMTVEVVWQ